MLCLRTCIVLVVVSISSTIYGQKVISGGALKFKSTGSADSEAWVLDNNGYVGTYIRLASPGPVSIAVQASGHADGGAAPHGNIVVGDKRFPFDPIAERKAYVLDAALPAGMHFVRIEFTNDAPGADRSMTIASLNVTGAEIVNDHNDANALAAADNYIVNFRKGSATVAIPGVAAGTPVRVRLKNHAFNFGVCITLDSEKPLLAPSTNPNSDEFKYQQFVNANFNAIVAGNAGKWAYNERQPGTPTMQTVDMLLDYGKAHGQRVRMHTLIWGNQQPDWVHALLKRAQEGDDAAKQELRKAITRRIAYYIRDRAKQFIEIDVLNEALRNPSYWTIFGPTGIADIYSECARAVAEAGGTALLFTNEYNVLQWSFDKDANGKDVPDPYANWYRKEIEAIRNADGAVTAIGVQYYADISKSAQRDGPHSAARILQAFQTLSVAGLPISLTEFGVQRGQDKSADPLLAAQALQETLRMAFGTEQVNGFLIWGIRKPWLWERADVGALLDADWNPTPAGERMLELRKQWTTDVTVPAGADGKIQFTGFYGEYEVTAGDKTRAFTLEKGKQDYVLP